MRESSLLLVLLFVSTLSGCGEEEPVQVAPTPAAPAVAPLPNKPGAKVPVEEAKDLPPPVDFQETAFVESERSRDPFRNFAKVFVNEARGEVRSQREVVLEQYAIDELRLVALIQRIDPPRAMLVDPSGIGHVVQRG
jgi:type IV pilus assembly protein PilP